MIFTFNIKIKCTVVNYINILHNLTDCSLPGGCFVCKKNNGLKLKLATWIPEAEVTKTYTLELGRVASNN